MPEDLNTRHPISLNLQKNLHLNWATQSQQNNEVRRSRVSVLNPPHLPPGGCAGVFEIEGIVPAGLQSFSSTGPALTAAPPHLCPGNCIQKRMQKMYPKKSPK